LFSEEELSLHLIEFGVYLIVNLFLKISYILFSP